MQRKLLLVIGLITLFLITFVIALFLTFPTDSTRHYAESSLNNMMKGKQIFEIKDLSVSPLLNVTVKDISMRPATVEQVPEHLMIQEGEYSGYFCAKSVEPMTFIIDEVFLNPKALKTFSGLPEGTFEIKVSGGEITGKLVSARFTEEGEEEEKKEQEAAEDTPEEEKETARSKKKSKKTDAEDKKSDKTNKKPQLITSKKKQVPTLMSVNAKGNRIDLSKLVLLSNATGAQFYGELDFDTRAKLENNKLKDMNLKLNMLSTALCPKRIQSKALPAPITVPFMILGDIEGELTVQNDVVKIVKLTNTGPDVVFDVQGTISLPVGNVKEPDFNLSIKVSPAQEWLEANEWEEIYKLCRRQDDGSIELKLSGKASNPKADCGKPVASSKPASETKKPAAAEKKPDNKDGAAPETKTDASDKKAAPPERAADNVDGSKKKSVNNLGETFRRQRPDPEHLENDLRHVDHHSMTQAEMDQISMNPRARRAMREAEAAAEGDLRMKRTGRRDDLSNADLSDGAERFPKREPRARRPLRE